MSRRILEFAKVMLAFAIALQIEAASAETVEVAPGVQVTSKTFAAPPNEAPFYGFAEKSATLVKADEIFVSLAVETTGSRQQAFERVVQRGWEAINGGDMAEAARRFNQASLLLPAQSQIFHGFAIVALVRFNDQEFAEELFRTARNQPGALDTLNADYGRMLLIAKRPKDAEPVLEQAVLDAPKFGNAWSNLGIARLQNGNTGGACAAAEKASRLQNAANVDQDIQWIRQEARCSGH